jgi:hypothetical protein
MRVRVPAILEQVLERNRDYPEPVRLRLAQLQEALRSNHPLPALDETAPYASDWLAGLPTFVSDATARALQQGRLQILPHPFWNGHRSLWELPSDLEGQLTSARRTSPHTSRLPCSRSVRSRAMPSSEYPHAEPPSSTTVILSGASTGGALWHLWAARQRDKLRKMTLEAWLRRTL